MGQISIQDLVFSVKLHFKKKLVKEGVFSPKCFGIKQDLGLKCSAWKVFGSKDFGLVGLHQKTKLDLFGSKKFGSENFLSQKKFWSKKICSEKMLVQMKILGRKIILWSKKVFESKKFFG